MNLAPYLLTKARFGYRLGNAELIDAIVHDGLWCPFERQHMGLAAEWIAESYGVSREAQDEFACASHTRALATLDTGKFQEEIAAVPLPQRKGPPQMFEVDENPRRDTCLDVLRTLKPAFKEGGAYVGCQQHAGITDGAAALIVARRSAAAALGLKPLARITGYAQAAVKPLELSPRPSSPFENWLKSSTWLQPTLTWLRSTRHLRRRPVADMRALNLDPARVNVNGGAIALGHPIGASGTRVWVTLLYALRERGQATGVATLCLGGGEAVALAVELE